MCLKLAAELLCSRVKPYHFCIKRFCSSIKAGEGLTSNEFAPVQPRKPKAKGYVEDAFIDNRRVQVIGGKGGDGCIAFLREMHNPFGGPSGGDGGNGGHVVFVADASITSLKRIPSIIRGLHGRHGQGDNCHGKCADHSFIPVPLGTAVYEVISVPQTNDQAATKARNSTTNDETLRKLVDMNTVDQRFVAARGGAGGRGNAFFLSNEEKAPTIAQRGAHGEFRTIYLEMTLVAHAGLVGVPNAGKSSLLSSLTRARPKIASYPFTTLSANVGIVEFEDSTQLRIADLPGLVAESHENRGLGYAFLRHVRKCLCLIFVLDATGRPNEVNKPANKATENDSQSEIHRVRLTPIEQFETVRDELLHYDASLLERPHMFLFNKSDLIASKTDLDHLVDEFKTHYVRKYEKQSPEVLCVSAKASHNLHEAITLIRRLCNVSNSTPAE